MLVNYRVFVDGPDGQIELGRFATLSNAQCFMFAWADVPVPENGYDGIFKLDARGESVYLVDETDWMDLEDFYDELAEGNEDY